MTPPPSLLARLFDGTGLGRPWRRRAVFAIGLGLLGALTLASRVHIARAELAPREAPGANAALAQAGAGAPAATGGRFSTEAVLSIARSQSVMADAADRLRRQGVKTDPSAVDVAALRGAIIQVTARDRAPEVARAEVTAVVGAIQDRLVSLTRAQFADRRAAAARRLADALGAQASDPAAQQGVRELYDRYMQGVAADEITADPGLDVIQPTYVDPRAAFDTRAEAAFALLALLALLAEAYDARPPVGRRA